MISFPHLLIMTYLFIQYKPLHLNSWNSSKECNRELYTAVAKKSKRRCLWPRCISLVMILMRLRRAVEEACLRKRTFRSKRSDAPKGQHFFECLWAAKKVERSLHSLKLDSASFSDLRVLLGLFFPLPSVRQNRADHLVFCGLIY